MFESDQSSNIDETRPASSVERDDWPHCRACFEPIHPKASVCKSCQTHQRYPKWISSLAPGLGMLLALLSITSLLLTDILETIFPDRGSVAAFIRDHEDGKRFVVAFNNIGTEPVTVEADITCPVFHPFDFDDDMFLSGNRLRALTLVRSQDSYYEPTVLAPNTSADVTYEIIGFGYDGNTFDDDIALSSVRMNWLSRTQYADSSPRIPEIVSELESPDELIELIATGLPPELGDNPFYGLVRDPESGVNAVWRCELSVHDRHGEVDGSLLTNPFAGAVIEPENGLLSWRLIFQDHAPPEVNPDINPWGSSCRTCPLARFP